MFASSPEWRGEERRRAKEQKEKTKEHTEDTGERMNPSLDLESEEMRADDEADRSNLVIDKVRLASPRPLALLLSRPPREYSRQAGR